MEKHLPGRPIIQRSEENVQKAHPMVDENRKIGIESIVQVCLRRALDGYRKG